MNRTFLAIFFLLFGVFSRAQVITGVVLDKESEAPISFASLFFNGTFVGTTTNDQGWFELSPVRIS